MASSLLAFLTAAVSLFPAISYAQLQTEYDYIVCGAGPGGLTIANKLSAQPGVSVLVVEAASNTSVENWGYRSVPQEYMNGRVVDLLAGKAVGGSTQINGL